MKKNLTACAGLDNLLDYVFVPGTEDESEESAYFGIPSISEIAGWICSDAKWAKQQKERMHAFVGQHEFLSNMHLCTIEVSEDEIYPSVENAFQAMKCKTKAERLQFCSITPQAAKKLGAMIKPRSDWDNIRIPVMKKLLQLKFGQNDDLAIELLKTDGALCENNYWGDTFWGKCWVEETHYFNLESGEEISKEEYEKLPDTCGKYTRKERHYRGENHLGKLLCEVRENIRSSGTFNNYFGNFAEQINIDVDWIGC